MVGIRVLVAIIIAHLSSYYCASQADMVRVRLGWAKSSKAGLTTVARPTIRVTIVVTVSVTVKVGSESSE